MSFNQTRDKIVSVADMLFRKFGFQKTSMDEIAKTSRKAKGSLYYHFSSKEELFSEVVQNEINILKAKLGDVVTNNEYTAETKLLEYMMVRMKVMLHSDNYRETLQAGQFDYFEFIDDIRKDLDVWEREQLIIIINEGIDHGEFAIDMEVGVLSDMFLMIIKGLEIPFFLQNKYQEYFPYFNGMAKILIKGMR
ncbi:MAG: TetR/AcrR family transcriptional regulator [Bacteroidales bacterium]|jgi:AcrR family transcriptional regulator|nr:TetR/AcrR family transcriptional regulator [Bacteroidales bacterium]